MDVGKRQGLNPLALWKGCVMTSLQIRLLHVLNWGKGCGYNNSLEKADESCTEGVI